MRDPIDTARVAVEVILDARDTLKRREDNGIPRMLPGWDDLTNATVANKVVGHLLDLGWTPPGSAS